MNKKNKNFMFYFKKIIIKCYKKKYNISKEKVRDTTMW